MFRLELNPRRRQLVYNETEKRAIHKADGPYLYFCPVGRHEWKLWATEKTIPPAMDGACLTCPEHEVVGQFDGLE